MYKATMEIGGYKKGDVVPDEKAVVWLKMYDVSPVKKVGGESSGTKEESKEEAKDSNVMIDDYLGRNSNVVKKNVEKDDLDKSTLKDLLKMEKSNKKRKDVIKAIEKKIEEGE